MAARKQNKKASAKNKVRRAGPEDQEDVRVSADGLAEGAAAASYTAESATAGSSKDEIEALLAAQAESHDASEDPGAGSAAGAGSGQKQNNQDNAFTRGTRGILRFRTPIIILLLFLLGGSIFYSYWFKDTSEDVDATMLVPSVRAERVATRNYEHTIESPGTVTFLEKAAVTSKVLGRVEQLLVDQGEYVRKGQPLAQMETFELELQLKQARAGVNRAEAQLDLSRARYQNARRDADRQIKDLERIQSDIIEAKANYLNSRRNMQNQQEIYEMGGISREELKTVYAQYISSMSRYYQTRKNYQIRIVGFRDEDLQKAGIDPGEVDAGKREAFIDFNTQVERGDVKVAEAAVRNARLELDSINLLIAESTIRSPLDGVIASRAIEVGESAKDGEPLFTVIRMDQVLISTSIPEEEVQNIQQGQSVSYTVDALANFEDPPRGATVYQISPVIDVSTRTAEVRLLAQNKELDLNPGMFVRAAIATRAKTDIIAIPETALLARRTENDGVDQVADVFVIQDSLVLRRKVVLGERYADRVEIRGGVEVGESIAIENVQNLKDGGSVRVVATESAPGSSQDRPVENRRENRGESESSRANSNEGAAQP